MDPAIIPPILTGAVAIVAGLGGSALTGYFNRKNTVDTLAAARKTNEDQWTRTQEREHHVWLRDNRQESYVAFFDEVEKITTLVRKGRNDEIPLAELDNVASLRGRIRLIGTHRIRVQARDIHQLLGQTVVARNVYIRVIRQTTEDLASDKEREKEAANRWKAKLAKVDAATIEFVNLVREDLGTTDTKGGPQNSGPEMPTSTNAT